MDAVDTVGGFVDTTTMMGFGLAAVFLVLYLMRRRSRLKRED
jgi:hypothetical protein